MRYFLLCLVDPLICLVIILILYVLVIQSYTTSPFEKTFREALVDRHTNGSLFRLFQKVRLSVFILFFLLTSFLHEGLGVDNVWEVVWKHRQDDGWLGVWELIEFSFDTQPRREIPGYAAQPTDTWFGNTAWSYLGRYTLHYLILVGVIFWGRSEAARDSMLVGDRKGTAYSRREKARYLYILAHLTAISGSLGFRIGGLSGVCWTIVSVSDWYNSTVKLLRGSHHVLDALFMIPGAVGSLFEGKSPEKVAEMWEKIVLRASGPRGLDLYVEVVGDIWPYALFMPFFAAFFYPVIIAPMLVLDWLMGKLWLFSVFSPLRTLVCFLVSLMLVHFFGFLGSLEFLDSVAGSVLTSGGTLFGFLVKLLDSFDLGHKVLAMICADIDWWYEKLWWTNEWLTIAVIPWMESDILPQLVLKWVAFLDWWKPFRDANLVNGGYISTLIFSYHPDFGLLGNFFLFNTYFSIAVGAVLRALRRLFGWK